MGKAAKVRRLEVSLAVGGREVWTRARAALTYSRVWNIFTFQLKNKLMSAEPRLVVERTDSRPGTLFTASSIGCVTVTCIWSIGATPLSTPTAIRGKSVDGNTATGMVKARYTPAAIRVRMTKMMGREKRAVQCSVTVICRRLGPHPHLRQT